MAAVLGQRLRMKEYELAENGTCLELEEGLTKNFELPVERLAESAKAAVLGQRLRMKEY